MELRDNLRDLSERWMDLRLLLQVLLALVFALGLTFMLAAILEPQWPLLLLLQTAPTQFLGLIRWMGVNPKLAMVLMGAPFTILAVALFALAEVRYRRGRPFYEEMREDMLLRLLVLGSFLLGFVGARTVVVMANLAGTGGAPAVALSASLILGPFSIPVHQVWIFGYHIHHFFYGFILLLIVGWFAIFRRDYSRRRLAVLYGLGVGIFVDEFSLIITWGDYYASQSWFVAIVFVTILMLAMLWAWGTSGHPPTPGEET